MKQFRLLSYLFVAVLCLGFVSCSDDDDPTFEDSQLVGTWTVTKEEGWYYEDGEKMNEKPYTYEDGEWIYSFEKEGAGVEYESNYASEFNWKLKDGNQLTLTYKSYNVTYKITSLNEQGCVIERYGKYEDEDNEFYEKFTLKKYQYGIEPQ